ncbi:MAG: restriction endonuclease subunit S [Candidatus Accumulibacter necessarius]|jgi:type I restriction enzyme S subunit|uniref:restriction endonuclease subunit S n=1 Tax=Candidatus Accumulibacter necessarius TaxID=2954386 RepID=UPI002FC2ED45
MRAGWQSKPFEDCIDKVTYTTKIQRKDFLDAGAFPVVSQEDAFINGYWDSADDVFLVETPLVIFGDHTKVLKYIDFDFVLGADGVKLLPPKAFLVPKFFYYQLQTAQLDSLGYARHYKLLKELKIKYPDTAEQHRIVAILDEVFDGIATAKANAEKNLQNARALFESHLQSVFTERGDGWKQKTLEEIATAFGRGKSRHRPRNAPHLYGGKFPFVQTGDIRNADHVITEYSQTYSDAGLTQSKLWPKGTICITIAANIAETAILGFDACFPDSVIGVVANPKEADVDFIEYLLQSFKARIQSMGKGSAQANINMGTFENERFPFPPVAEQKAIVAKLDSLNEETQRLETIYQQKLTALDDLKKSLLHQAFSGQL